VAILAERLRTRSPRGRIRVPAALALPLVAIVVLGPIVAPFLAQPASRGALTASIVEHHTIDLRGYPLGVDKSRFHGHLRSDKAPGQPFLAVPFYAVARAAGAESLRVFRYARNLTQWWLTLWTGVVPFALLLVLMRRAARRVAPRHATAVAIALGAGTIIMPHSVNLYGHTLAALFGFAAYEALRARPLDERRALLGGVLAGAAVATEYQTLIIAVVLAGVAAFAGRRALAGFATGIAGPLIALGAYEWRAFGAPWRTPYAWYAGQLGVSAAVNAHARCTGQACATVVAPRVGWFLDATVWSRGLLCTSPIVLIGIVGAVVTLRGRASAGRRRDASVALAVSVGYLVLVSGFTAMPFLEEPGPRFLIPAIPFLAVPLAMVWERWAALCRVVAAYGVALMLAASTTLLLVARGDTALHTYLARVLHHEFLPTVWSMPFGRMGVFLYLLTVGVSIVWLVRAEWRPAFASPRTDVRPR
jgi:hypothetical protein